MNEENFLKSHKIKILAAQIRRKELVRPRL